MSAEGVLAWTPQGRAERRVCFDTIALPGERDMYVLLEIRTASGRVVDRVALHPMQSMLAATGMRIASEQAKSQTWKQMSFVEEERDE